MRQYLTFCHLCFSFNSAFLKLLLSVFVDSGFSIWSSTRDKPAQFLFILSESLYRRLQCTEKRWGELDSSIYAIWLSRLVYMLVTSEKHGIIFCMKWLLLHIDGHFLVIVVVGLLGDVFMRGQTVIQYLATNLCQASVSVTVK